MQMQDNKYNYLQIPIDELPSRGILYPEGTIFKGRFMTIQDVKFLALLTPATATAIVNEIIERCIYMTIEFKDLLLCDREYLALWLRANSFMKESGYNFSISNCIHCNGGFESKITLDDLSIVYLEEKPVDIILPHSKQQIKIKLPRVSDLKIIYDDKDIEYAARCINLTNDNDALALVLNLDAYDYAYLISICKRYHAGFNTHITLMCPLCGKPNYMDIILSDDVLFSEFDMQNIINIIMRISKYIGYGIVDTTAWPELEMIQDVYNAMVKEENDEMTKQEQKAKAAAAAAKAKASTSIHH